MRRGKHDTGYIARGLFGDESVVGHLNSFRQTIAHKNRKPKALDPAVVTFYRPPTGAAFRAPFLFGATEIAMATWVISSAVEHFVDIEGVTGSIPVSPTTCFTGLPMAGCPQPRRPPAPQHEETTMKVRNSLRSLKNRHRDCRVVRRKGRVYVINKTQRRFKARQG